MKSAKTITCVPEIGKIKNMRSWNWQNKNFQKSIVPNRSWFRQKKNLHSGFRQNKKPSFRHSRTKNLHFTSDFGEMVPRDGARPHEKNVSLVFSASVFSQHRLVLVSAHGLRTLFLRVHRPVGCCLEWRRFDAHALETWDSRFASFQDCRRKNRWWWEERSIHIIYMCFHQCTYVCRHMCTSYIYIHACMHAYIRD